MRLLSFLLIILCFSCSNKEEKYYEVVKEKLNGNVQSIKYVEYSTNFTGQLLDTLPNTGFFVKYDKNGRVSENSYYIHSDEKPNKETYKYDEKGNIIEFTYYYSNGELAWRQNYKYDVKGNLIEENRYNYFGTREERYNYEYEFDKKGNWINKTVYRQDLEDTKKEIYKKINREIKYY